MAEWFECKIKYERAMDNGVMKKFNEPYLVDALNFTEAERRIIEEIAPFMTGEFQVSDIKRPLFHVKTIAYSTLFRKLHSFFRDVSFIMENSHQHCFGH